MLIMRLKRELDNLSKSERRIAEVILADPETAVHATTAEIARQAEVSDPMVSRLCRSLGCKGFPEFKVQLAQSLASDTSFVTQSVSASDSADTYINKLIGANQSALDYLRHELSSETIERAVDLLDAAKRIEIFGMGGCSSIAHDAQHKLFRLGTPTIAYEDNLKQRMAAASADENTLILFISFTGRTRAMVETAHTAQASGAKSIAICDPTSPLAKACDLVITSGSELEDTTIYVPMQTRIMILTIIDILATGMALKRSPAIDKSLRKMKETLESTKVTED
jgi:RpiR family transcriptional regulator, carbohydrate utilization regulator